MKLTHSAHIKLSNTSSSSRARRAREEANNLQSETDMAARVLARFDETEKVFLSANQKPSDLARQDESRVVLQSKNSLSTATRAALRIASASTLGLSRLATDERIPERTVSGVAQGQNGVVTKLEAGVTSPRLGHTDFVNGEILEPMQERLEYYQADDGTKTYKLTKLNLNVAGIIETVQVSPNGNLVYDLSLDPKIKEAGYSPIPGGGYSHW